MTDLTRRNLVAALSGLAGLGLVPPLVARAQEGTGEQAADESYGMSLGAGTPFSSDVVIEKARLLAAAPFVPPPETSKAWRELSYDQVRGIWFDGRNALFRNDASAVQAEFFLAARYSHQKIAMNAVEGGKAYPVDFHLDRFDRTDWFPDLPEEGTGFSGFRLLGELELPGIFQEYAVFQGASYFRAITRGGHYGLSARGLAINTAGTGPEEFPVFREFWIEAVEARAETVTVHALLDSQSVSGAYVFRIRKGDTTVMQVTARLFPRADIATAGIGAGTSMFFFGDLNPDRFDDFRQAVHDSDGLLMLNGAGETLWRPLSNPAGVEVSAFADRNPRGFGLMQRRRDPAGYEDLEAVYERRPSLWVEPMDDWGDGQVILAEIPTDTEYNDNIVAFWRPAEVLKAGQEHLFRYRLHWSAGATEATLPPRARVVASRTGMQTEGTGRIFAIDYADHPALSGAIESLTAQVTTSQGAVSFAHVIANPATGGVRLVFVLDEPASGACELRAELLKDGASVGETWLYRWVTA